MAQATLTAANAIQSKTDNATAANAVSVSLDAGTQAGSTVTIELSATGTAITDAGFGGHVPPGFELDAMHRLNSAVPWQLVFRKRNVAAGEGVAGSTAWDFATSIGSTTVWSWRVTEWDADLEPVCPLERAVSNQATGAGVTTLSTGTTAASGRPNVVALAWHHWQCSTGAGRTFSFSNHTNGFTERDELRLDSAGAGFDDSWSWKFVTATEAFECTVTVNNSAPSAADLFTALLVVYAATTYV